MSCSNTIINPKSCSYGYGLQMYQNTSSSNAYWEVFVKKKHICLNKFISNIKIRNGN